LLFKDIFVRYVITIKGEWKDLKPKLREKFQDLSDEDVEFSEGKYDEMMTHLQEKLGNTRQQFVRMLNNL
jgi:uncharacterized protein YjbJ (UPF0337 family)